MFAKWSFFIITSLLIASPGRAQTIPFHSTQNLIFVEANVNGKRGSFIVDTGASSSLISYRLAGLGKYPLPKMKNAGTPGGEGFSGQAFAVKADFVFVGVTIKELPVYAGNVDALAERTGEKCDGLIGQDILRHFKSVKIDYRKQVIEFEP